MMCPIYFRKVFFGILFSFFCALFLLPDRTEAKKQDYLPQDLFCVSFPTQQDGWACGRWGTILHTGNGGETWTRQQSTTDYTLSSICFVDAQLGFAVGDGGTILSTTDGGASWESRKSPVRSFLMGIHFANTERGWIITERTTILHTKDGGKSWQLQFSDGDFILKSMSFYDSYNGWAVGEYGYIYHTDNGGETWQQQAGGFGFSEETGEIVGGNILFDVVAVNYNTAWVVGIDGYVARTVDSGVTWQQVACNVPKTHLFAIAADGAGKLFIGGTSLLLARPDQEAFFRRVNIEPQITYDWIYHIARRGGAGLVAVGKKGLIYLSDNQGLAWRCVSAR